jgi:hypothetical protein
MAVSNWHYIENKLSSQEMIRNKTYMIKRNLVIPVLLLLSVLQAGAQVNKQETGLKREVTLYNPYKPSLSVVKKMSFLPNMNDTAKVKPEFHYAVSAEPFQPEYKISPIKAAALLPDPLPKLYKSYIKAGFGNHISPLAEISITNERSKKGSFGIYGRHFSTNDDIVLQNAREVFGGYMDNDASLFGRKLFQKSTLEGSVDFTQKIRHAYGYNPEILDYNPQKKDIRMNYSNIGAKASFSSLNLDSAEFYYDFDIYYNYFHQSEYLFQHNGGMEGIMAKSFKGFYVGSGLSYEYYNNSDSITANSDFIASLSPFLKKKTDQWNFKLGLQALIDRNSNLHLYPDVEFGFTIVPSYLSFYASLTGKMEKNEPLKIITENPYLVSDQFPEFAPKGMLFRLDDSNHKLVINSGLKGNTGIGGNYLVSATYSIIENMLFYSNIVFPDTVVPRAMGNYFMPLTDSESDIKLLNIHAEMSGPLNDKISYSWMANLYDYNTTLAYAWNKPDWDGKLGLKYNLRDKIIAGMELTAIGKRRQIVNGDLRSITAGYVSRTIEMPAHFNLNLNAEYRYSRILSFWASINNIAIDRYYEWAYYPSQKFLFMLGFTYSL